MNSKLTFLTFHLFNSTDSFNKKMATSSKGCKPDNIELHNSLKLCFTNIGGLPPNFMECESFLE